MSDTMNRLGQVCPVVYVDGGIEAPGDGGTPATAAKDIPAPAERAKDTIYLCRKTLSANIAFDIASGGQCYFIAMPKESDYTFNDAPLAARESWNDSGSPDHAFSVSGGGVTFIQV